MQRNPSIKPGAFWVLALGMTATSAIAAPGDTRLREVEITSSKLATDVNKASATVDVITGDELRARGATDLRTALALVAGVEASPGGDGGPASSVPALWGLREFDAFLLLVDGVPWGGAFIPALSTIDLTNVERIEVQKGGAPVSYGATSFVGVIHVIHYAAGEGPSRWTASVGSRGSQRAAFYAPFGDFGDLKQSITLDGENVELSNDRAGYDRAHALYRLATPLAGGALEVDADLSVVNQDPLTPHPREGRVLSPRVPVDANHNPSDARIDQDRFQLSGHFRTDTGLGAWDTRLAYAHAQDDLTRGFLREDFATDGVTINADGYRQDREFNDVYFDSHLETAIGDAGSFLWGVDWLYGKGEQDSDNFEYAVRGDGRGAPSSRSRNIDESTEAEDERNFGGLYGEFRYAVTEDWQFDAGLRVNYTHETRDTGAVADDGEEIEGGSDSRNDTRVTGAIGSSYRVWNDGSDFVTAYANYKDTFKPAVIDFGPEAEPEILDAEEATSGEIGLRGTSFDGTLTWDAAAFYIDFQNLVVPQTVDGLPGLANAGNQHHKGLELEATWHATTDLAVSGNWAYHQARFGDYVRLFGSTPTQLQGKQMELSPDHLAAIGLLWTPAQGFNAYLTGNYVGDRYLNKRNTAPANGYATLDAGLGYKWGQWGVRVDGYNLTDRRDATAESELGDGQYYRMPARSAWLTVSYEIAE